MKRDPEYTPDRAIWILFDQNNGHAGGRRYLWWFDTREEARKAYREVKKDPRRAPLSAPQKWVPWENIQTALRKVRRDLLLCPPARTDPTSRSRRGEPNRFMHGLGSGL